MTNRNVSLIQAVLLVIFAGLIIWLSMDNHKLRTERDSLARMVTHLQVNWLNCSIGQPHILRLGEESRYIKCTPVKDQ
jgi:cell division protein FtsL